MECTVLYVGNHASWEAIDTFQPSTILESHTLGNDADYAQRAGVQQTPLAHDHIVLERSALNLISLRKSQLRYRVYSAFHKNRDIRSFVH